MSEKTGDKARFGRERRNKIRRRQRTRELQERRTKTGLGTEQRTLRRVGG